MEHEPNKAFTPNSIEDMQVLIRESNSVRVLGREDLSETLGSVERIGSPKLEAPTTHISLSAFNQIVEYLPEEYTITVQAGVPAAEVQAALAAEGQYLPFDPPFSAEGTTVGAMIAKGLSGPGSFRYGILRDFILGVNFIDGIGNHSHTGGKVVKNAAGFDIPKLMSGSYGSFGIITEASFKVFPVAPERRTIVFNYPSFQEAHEAFVSLGRSRFTLDILDLDSKGRLFLKLAGQPGSMDQRVKAIESHLTHQSDTLSQKCIDSYWPESVRLETPPQSGLLVKIPINPLTIFDLESALASYSTEIRYSIGGYVCWLHWNNSIEKLSALFTQLNLSGQVACGDAETPLIAADSQKSFYRRLKSAFDPEDKFTELYPTALQPAFNE